METRRKLAMRTATAAFVIAGAIVTAVAATRGDGGTGRDGTDEASATSAPAAATLSAPTGIASGSSGDSGATSRASFSAVERLAPPAVTNITPGYLSLPLRDLPQVVGPLVPRPESVEPPEGSYPSPPDQGPGFTDPVVQSIEGPNVMPAATSFDGLQNQNNVSIPSIANSARPPDSEGDVGPAHYVQWIYYAADPEEWAVGGWRTRVGSFRFDEQFPTSSCPPTAVTVKSFGARWRGNAVAVSWRTASEVDALGFNLYRSLGTGPFRKVNRALIAAKHGGRAGGARYRLVDRSVRRGPTYTYRLQIVSLKGARTWHSIGAAAVR